MKASVITMHRIYNYGSVLQTYATQKILEDMGITCEIIDYISPYRAKKPLFLEYPPKLEGKKLKKILYYAAKIPSFMLKDISFGGFIKKYIHLSEKQYITNDDILRSPPTADVYITGSDQVWNSKYNHGVDKSYYLNYAAPGAKKISFVSSFGKSELTNDEIKEICPMLEEYAALSVREDSGVDILSDMGIKSVCLIDPTLQIDKKDWLSLSSKRLVKEKYLLLFLLYNEDNGASEYAVKIAKEKGLKIVKLSWELKKPKGVDQLFTHRKPQDFLSLFANADFIVTNSFHGVAFSIYLNSQFVFVPRSEFNDRILSLLKKTGLTDRVVKTEEDLKAAYKPVEFRSVNAILEKERKNAGEYLSNALGRRT